MSGSEVWKDVLGYEGLYKVSDRGNVYSVVRKDARGNKIGGRMLKPSPNTGGYLHLQLCKNGIREDKLIHRLVLEAFVENPNNLPDVNHRDEVKTNNELSNLEWCDARYNNNYGTRIERFTQTLSKKVRAVNVETGEVLTFSSTSGAGRKGYHQGSVSQACRGVYNIGGGNLYRGYRWSYEKVVPK